LRNSAYCGFYDKEKKM